MGWILFLLLAFLGLANGDAPISFFDWTVDYMTISPLGVKQQVIGINGRFPGPVLNTTTNRINIVNVHNNLDEPFLLTWDGIQNRRNAWMDGVSGTSCPIPSGQNFTFNITAKDQIGSFFYWPTTLFQRASGGVGAIRVNPRSASGVRVPFGPPDGDIIIMIGDWYTRSHKDLRASLDKGATTLGMPDGVLINGKGPYNRTTDYETIAVRAGHVYRLRVTNIGISTTLNFRIQGHPLIMVETEGSYTVQSPYDSVDIFVGQTYSFLLNCTQNISDYYVVASPRFVSNETEWANITGIGVLHYLQSKSLVSGPLPEGPSVYDGGWSINQARQIRRNLTTGAARPNPQGSFHYGQINITDTVVFTSGAVSISGNNRFAINGISFLDPSTPMLLADEFNLTGVYKLNGFPQKVAAAPALETSVITATYAGFMEIIFQNPRNDTVDSWHVDGYAAFVVGYGPGMWTNESRGQYNKWDAVSRSTIEVFPGSWTAIQISLDNVGLWNIRSEDLVRYYLGQQMYMRVDDPSDNIKNTAFPKPDNVLYCGKLSYLAPKQRKHKNAAPEGAKPMLYFTIALLLAILYI